MANLVFGDHEGGMFNLQDIPEIRAIEAVTGQGFGTALDEQIVTPLREACPQKNCGAFINTRSRMDSVSIDTGMGGYIPGESLFVDVETGCSKGGSCPCHDAVEGMTDQVQSLAEVCIRATDEAYEEHAKIVGKAERAAAKVLKAPEAEAERIRRAGEEDSGKAAKQLFEQALKGFRSI